jgi:hypothetical protein
MTMTEEHLEAHLRRTLHAVAGTVTDEARPLAPAPPRRRPVRRGGRLVFAAAGLAGASGLGLVAWDRWEDGEIRRIPTEKAVMQGRAAEGGAWWLLPSAELHPQACPSSVEMVSAARNRSGDEWNTGGVVYGELVDPRQPCPDQRPWLADPTRFSLGSSSLGTSSDGWDEDSAVGWFGTFHPTVARLRVTDRAGTTSVVDTVALPDDPDGPRFAAFTTPPGASEGTVVELLRADGSVVAERRARS